MLPSSVNKIFTNTGLTHDGEIWRKGIGYDAPGEFITRTNVVYDKAKRSSAKLIGRWVTIDTPIRVQFFKQAWIWILPYNLIQLPIL